MTAGRRFLLCLLLCTTLAGTSLARDGEGVPNNAWDEYDELPALQIKDPLYPVNRLIFGFNDKFYLWILDPVAKGYRGLIPQSARLSLRNFTSNLGAPVRFVNCVLQTRWEGAQREGLRFGINSTMGILGLRDVALSRYRILRQDEDLGQTFGYYGAGHGIYLVLPFLGASSLRDTLGMFGDGYLDPVHYASRDIRIIYHPARVINDASFRVGDYADLKKSAFDPYDSLRDVYLQYRDAKVRN